MSAPLVSFVVPAFNPGDWLDPCLQSIFNQTVEVGDVEVILVDDGSTHWPETGLCYHDRVTLIRRPNRGVSAARNTGYALAHGEFVCFLDADDTVLPEFTERLASPLQADPRLTGSYCNGKLNWMYPGPAWRPTRLDYGPVDDFRAALVTRPMNLGAMLFRRERLQHVGGFDLTLSSASEDWDFLLKLAADGQFCFVEAPLYEYRLTEDSMTRQFARLYDLTRSALLRHRLNDRAPQLSATEFRIAMHHLANWAVREGRDQWRRGRLPGGFPALLRFVARRPELAVTLVKRLLRP